MTVAVLFFVTTSSRAAQLAERASEPQSSRHADSKEITDLLERAKVQANKLKADASELESFTHSNLGWETHADKVNEIRNDVNAVGQTVAKLNSSANDASPWQSTAISRINPLLTELGENTTTVINHLNKEKGRFLNTQEHQELLQTNAELASDLAASVSDFVEYGKTRTKFLALRQKLELGEPGSR
ncbi:MAG TPA: hypothetical protein VGC07_05780 [Granulicella sp.]